MKKKTTTIKSAILSVVTLLSIQCSYATIHYDSTVHVITMFSGSKYFDFDNDFLEDLHFGFVLQNGIKYAVDGYMNSSTAWFLIEDNNAQNLIAKAFNKGEVYDSLLPVMPQNWAYHYSDLKQQFNAPNKYLVMKLSNSASYYGWIKVQTDTVNQTITINGWAYSDIIGYPLLPGETSYAWSGISDMAQNISFSLTKNFIRIEGDSRSIKYAEIYNMSGQLIENIDISQHQSSSIPVALNEHILYVVRLRKDDGTFFSKVVSLF